MGTTVGACSGGHIRSGETYMQRRSGSSQMSPGLGASGLFLCPGLKDMVGFRVGGGVRRWLAIL